MWRRFLKAVREGEGQLQNRNIASNPYDWRTYKGDAFYRVGSMTTIQRSGQYENQRHGPGSRSYARTAHLSTCLFYRRIHAWPRFMKLGAC